MSDIAVKAENLGKRYRLGSRERYKSLRESLMRSLRAARPGRGGGPAGAGRAGDREGSVWALREVSFAIERGDVVGVIGRNGAGKSTLLKILARITEPTEGRAEIRGRVGSLLEIGTGFHPELTGRENIYLNGAILGMRRAEIDRKFDEIVAFAEVEPFLDLPVKHYSSGMYMRLAFSVAAHLEPEILLIDEVLAVGDIAFQKKCLGKMGQVAREGRTVLFVSHNMAAVESLCPRSLLVHHGRLEMSGETRSVVERYLETIETDARTIPLKERTDRTGTGAVRLTDFFLEDGEGRRAEVVQSGRPATLVFTYERDRGVRCTNVVVAFHVEDARGYILFLHQNAFTGDRFDDIPGEGRFVCRIPRLPLVAGRYPVVVRVTVGAEEADYPRNSVGVIQVVEGDFFGSGNPGVAGHSPFLVDGSWRVEEEARAPGAVRAEPPA